MDKIIHNGTLCRPEEAGLGSPRLSEAPFLYQHLHTRGHRVLHAAMHLEILNAASQAAYGCTLPLEAEALCKQVATLLEANRAPLGGNGVMLLFYPEGLRETPSEAAYLLESSGPLYYNEYTLWHQRPTLTVMPCEYLLMGYPTLVARQVARYGRTLSRRRGAGAAVIETMDGVLTNVEDEPLFLVCGDRVLSTPLHEGATDSVMRRLVLRACQAEKINYEETPLRREMLSVCDEAFAPTVQGLTSFGAYERTRYFNLVAGKIAQALNRLEE